MTTTPPTCSVCGQPVTFARFDPATNTVIPGNYRIIGIQRTGQAASYGRAANQTYTNVYVHVACLSDWHAAHAASGQPITQGGNNASAHTA